MSYVQWHFKGASKIEENMIIFLNILCYSLSVKLGPVVLLVKAAANFRQFTCEKHLDSELKQKYEIHKCLE